LRQEKRVQEARMVLESAVMYAPHCAALRKALTEICLETGRYDEVITQGQTLLALRPRSVFALDALVAAYIQQGRIERALKLLQERLRILPDDAWTHFQCGALWRHLGNHAEAIGALERALKAKDIEEVLAQNICSAIEMLDRPQIRQILVLASEDLHFRLAVQKNPTEAIKERGFYLSHAGLVALSELHWRDFPVSRWQHTRYGHH
jgi:tetratricopeptide (TPR) repeat protein